MSQHRLAAAWGDVISRQRQHVLKMSRAQLADHIGVTRHMVRLWEKGIHAPGPRMQAVLIDKLMIDPVEIARLIRAGAA